MDARLTRCANKCQDNTIFTEFSIKSIIAQGWHNSAESVIGFLEDKCNVPNVSRLLVSEISWDNVSFNFGRPEWAHLMFTIDFDEITIEDARLTQVRFKRKHGPNKSVMIEVDFVFRTNSIIDSEEKSFSQYLDQKEEDENGRKKHIWFLFQPEYVGLPLTSEDLAESNED